MSGALVLRDDNSVLRAFPLSSIACVTLEYNGSSEPPGPEYKMGRPTAAVLLLNGDLIDHLSIPIVDDPKNQGQVESAIFNFFARLADGEPAGLPYTLKIPGKSSWPR